MSHPTDCRRVLDQLAAEQLVAASEIPDLDRTLHYRISMPWFVNLSITAGAFLAAVSVIVFLEIIGWLNDEASVCLGGLLLCALGLAAKQGAPGVFLDKFALAGVFVGQALAIGGLWEWWDAPSLAALGTFLFEVALWLVFPDQVQRFVSTLVGGGALAVWFHECGVGIPLELLGFLWVLVVGLVWLTRSLPSTGTSGRLDSATGFGALAGLHFLLIFGRFLDDEDKLNNSWVALGLTLGVLVLVVQILGETRQQAGTGRKIYWRALLALALWALLSFQAPGLMLGLGLLLLGFHRRDRLLGAVGGFSLILFGIQFYYELHFNLLEKSAILCIIGISLLGIRFVLLRLAQGAT